MSTGLPRSNVMIYFAATVAAMGGVFFGFDVSVVGGAILFIQSQLDLDATEVEIIVTATLIGALLLTPIVGGLADRFGRRKTLLACAALGVVGSIASGMVDGMVGLFLTRLLCGGALAGMTAIAPLFISEIAETRRRGLLVGFFVVGGGTGVVLAFLVDWLLSPGAHWRIMLAFGALPAIIVFIGMVVLPETPRWLLHHHHPDRARASLRRLRGVEDVEEELAELLQAAVPQGRWSDLFRKGALQSVIAGNTLAFFRETTGFTAILLYAPEICAMAGFTDKGLRIFESLLIASLLLIGSLFTTLMVDRVGRKPLLMVGMVGMTVAMATLAIAAATAGDNRAIGFVAVGAMMLWMLGFGIGPASVFFVLIAEIYPQAVRARGMSLACIVRWACDVLVCISFLSIAGWIGYPGIFAIFAGLTAVGTACCAILVRETRGQSLEQLEKAA